MTISRPLTARTTTSIFSTPTRVETRPELRPQPRVAGMPPSAVRPAPTSTTPQVLSDIIAQHLAAYFAAHSGDLPPAGLYDRLLPLMEKPLIEQSLTACKGNQIKAAELLGINRNTLRKKIKDLGIVVTRKSSAATAKSKTAQALRSAA